MGVIFYEEARGVQGNGQKTNNLLHRRRCCTRKMDSRKSGRVQTSHKEGGGIRTGETVRLKLDGRVNTTDDID